MPRDLLVSNMTRVLIMLALLLGLSTARLRSPAVVPDRADEPDPQEYRPFRMSEVVGGMCRGMRRLMHQHREKGAKIGGAAQLAQLVVERFDGEDGCLAGSAEIRSIAGEFGGEVTGYRTLFERVLDENKSGCVEADELVPLILDCMRPNSARNMEQQAFPDKYTAEEEERRMAEEEEDTELRESEEEDRQRAEQLRQSVEEEQQEEEVLGEEELAMLEENDRRIELEDSRKTSLDDAVKELLCSLLRREHDEPRRALQMIIGAISEDGDQTMSFNEFYEFIGSSVGGKEETDVLAEFIDTDDDSILSEDEILVAIDNCPVREEVHVPVVNARPFIKLDQKPCPTEQAMYKQLRTRAMKFVGTQGFYTDLRATAEAFYVAIAGDLEEVITPGKLDIPEYCVKECWRSLDSDKSASLNLIEFNRISFDLLEELMPRELKPKKIHHQQQQEEIQDSREEERLEQDLEDYSHILSDITLRISREMGLRLPESELTRLTTLLDQDEMISGMVDKMSYKNGDDAARTKLTKKVQAVLVQQLHEEHEDHQ